MSCSKCGSVTTSCGCKDTAYTTPKVYTCPPDTSCPQPVRCSEFMDAACIFLNDGIADAGIQPGSSLESIVQQLILLVTNPGCVDAPGGVPGGGTVTFVDAIWPGNAITIAGGPILNGGTFVFNGNGTSNQYIDGQGNLQTFPAIGASVEFQTNGTPNGSQTLLNIVAGTGVTLTESNGSVTIDVEASTYTVDNGLSADPTDPNNFQLGSATAPGAPLIHDTYIAGAQFRFEINNTNSMFLQGNRVDIEGAGAGAKVLSKGGASENSLEVTGTQVAIESVGTGATRIFLDPAKIRIQTPLFNTKANNDVLTLIDSATGEVEFMPPSGILLQTDGVDNADQTYLNLIPGNGIVLTNVDGDVTIDGPLFQTDGTDNSVQTLLNLVAGTGITLTESSGSVTIEAAAPAINLTTNLTGGAATYNPSTGDLNIPIYNSQIDVQDEGTSRVVNPTILNFVGAGVTVTNSGLEAIITIPGGGGPGSVDANNGLVLNTTDYPTATVQLGGPDTAPAPLVRNTYINTTAVSEYDFDISGSRVTKPIINISNTGQGTAVKGQSVGGYAIYGTTASGFSGYFEADNSLIGLYSVNKTGNLSAEFESVSSVNNTVIPVVRIMRTVNITSPVTNGADGIGASVDFFLEDDNNIAAQAGAISYEFTDATSGATVSQFAVTTADAGSLSRKLEITGAGQLILNNYTTATSFDPESGPSVGVLNVDNAGNVFVGSGTGLSIQVDSNPFSSSSLLNFLPSTDIGVTDLGGGAIQFSLVNPLVTYDSNNGVYNNSDIFQLGVSDSLITAADFQTTRYINANTYSLNINGPGNTVTSGVLNVSGGDYGIEGRGNIRGVSGIAIGGTSASFGGYFEGFTTMYGISFDPGGRGVEVVLSGGTNMNSSQLYSGSAISYDNADQIYDAVTISRSIQGTIPLQNFGSAFSFLLSAHVGVLPGTPQYSSRLISKWFNPATASLASQFEIQGANGPSTVQTQFTILGGGTSGPAGAWSLTPGQIKFDRYAGGVIYKPADDIVAASGFNLGIDANGNIWATDFSTSTGPVTGVSNISIGTLSNGATATVSNPSGPAATINITGQNAYTQIAGDTGTASANVFNSQFNVIGANGVSTSVTNNTSPTADVITVTGPNKYLNFVTKNILGTNIATYTPTTWNETLNIQAGSGITITNGGSANTIIISGGAGTGTVSNVTGATANGFTVGVTNGTTTPEITVETNITGVLVGNGTSVSAVTGTGVMVFSGTGYTFQTLPTVNDGQFVIGANGLGATNTSVVLTNSGGGVFTANKATNSTYLLNIGPAIANLVTLMTAAMPVNPPVSGGAVTVLPPYIVKTGQDTYTVQTPVTTFSPGSTGFTVTSLVSSATTGPLNGAVVLGGALNVASGGTGLTTSPGEGQILIGNSTGGFNIGNITAGNPGITVTSSGSGIQISATGSTVSVLNGLHTHAADGSIRLGSGSTGDVIRPLVESTDIRMNDQFYRLSNGNTGIISAVGFQINDAAAAKVGFFGSSTGGTATTANTPQVAFTFSGVGGTALASFAGFYIDNTTADIKTYSGFSSNVRQVITRSSTAGNNKITQVGTWGVTADQTFYEAIPLARTIQIGSTGGNNNWIKLDDANQRVDISKATIYASAYGTGAVTGASLAALIAVDPTGKFYEFAGRSISNITGNTGTFTAGSMASATAPVAFSIQGSGTISTSITGNVLTISNSATAFPYWSTIGLTAAAGSSGSVVGDTSVIPNVAGANTLNLIAGNNITFTGADASNRIQIDAVVPPIPNSWGNITLSASGGTASGGPLVPDAQLDALGFIAGAGITLTGNATNDTITVANSGITSITGSAGGSVSVSTTGGVTTITGPSIWNTIAVPTPGTGLPAQTSLTPDTTFDTLNFAAGTGITIATNSTTDTITISATGGAGTVNADQGLWKDTSVTPNEIELGSPTDGPAAFTVDRFINAAANTLFLKGTPAAGDADLVVTSSSVGRAIRAINTLAASEGAIYATALMDSSPDSAPTGTIYAESTAKGHAIVGVSNGADLSAIAGIFGTGRQGVKGYTTVTNGIGVYGSSVTGLGIGVLGEAVGNGTTSYAGQFGISNTTAAKQEVVKISKALSGAGEGATIGFYGGANKKGQIGYISDTIVTSSQYEATVVNSGVEVVRHRIESTGQHKFSSYINNTSFPLPLFSGNQYRGIILTANTGATGVDVGKIYTSRIEYGDYNAGLTITGSPTVSLNTTTYSLVGKIVTVNITGSFTYATSQTAGSRTVSFSLPAGATYTSSANGAFVFTSYRSTNYFSDSLFSVTGASASIALTIDTTMPANFVNKFYINLTYLTA